MCSVFKCCRNYRLWTSARNSLFYVRLYPKVCCSQQPCTEEQQTVCQQNRHEGDAPTQDITCDIYSLYVHYSRMQNIVLVS